MTTTQDPIAHAARLLREAAEELRQEYTLSSDRNNWRGDCVAKAAYDEHMAAAQALEDWEAAVGAGGVQPLRSVQEGCKLVPLEPTQEMLAALMSPGEAEVLASSPSETFALMLMDRAGIRERYSAMLAASPTPPAEQQAAPKAAPGEPSDWEPLKTSKEGRDAVRSFFREKLKRHDFDEYIMGTLAADFACVLGGYLRAAPQQEPSRDAKTWCSYVAGMIGCYLKKPDESAEVRAIAGIIERRLWALPAPQPAPAPLSDDAERDAAFEAVRKKLCALPRFSFLSDGYGVRRVPDKSGSWIAFDAAHAMFDPVAVDAALAAHGGK